MKADWKERLDQRVTLETPRLLLRPFQAEDAADVLAYGSDPETVLYLVWTGVHTLEEALESVTGFLNKPEIFALQEKESGHVVGCINLRPDEENESTEFGYILKRDRWNRGYMTEALSAVLHYCFEELEFNRVQALHYLANPPSGRVMAKCGMSMEGVGLQEVKVKGVFQDAVHYGITRTAWLARQAAKYSASFQRS